jgi:hypothetical protein
MTAVGAANLFLDVVSPSRGTNEGEAVAIGVATPPIYFE